MDGFDPRRIQAKQKKGDAVDNTAVCCRSQLFRKRRRQLCRNEGTVCTVEFEGEKITAVPAFYYRLYCILASNSYK
jgi:hypothetical protein